MVWVEGGCCHEEGSQVRVGWGGGGNKSEAPLWGLVLQSQCWSRLKEGKNNPMQNPRPTYQTKPNQPADAIIVRLHRISTFTFLFQTLRNREGLVAIVLLRRRGASVKLSQLNYLISSKASFCTDRLENVRGFLICIFDNCLIHDFASLQLAADRSFKVWWNPG